MSEWQPIETAPKDRRIRVWAHSAERHAKWDEDKYVKKPRPYWNVDGWTTTWSRYHKPSHWMPLSEPPDGR